MTDIREFSNSIVEAIAPSLLLCKKQLGVATFGYRRFLENGKSFGFSDNPAWNRICSEQFTGVNILEYERDLKKYIVLGQAHVMRKGEPDPKSPFLKALYENDVWNTFCLYQKNTLNHSIDAFFFGATRNDTHIFDGYIENLDFIHRWIQSIKAPLENCFNKKVERFFSQTITEQRCLEEIEAFFLAEKAQTSENILMSLSTREWQVFFLLAKGYKRRQIALKLGIARKTVDAILEHIKHKTNCLSKNQLLKFLQMPKIQGFLKNHEHYKIFS